MKNFKLSPSDLTFLWDECPRCFYLKVVLGINRPPSAFPKIFGRIDLLMKRLFEGADTTELAPELPPGHVLFGERWVESRPLPEGASPGHAFIRGKFDSVVAFDDGSYGVVDFKTSEPSPKHIPFYGRQLHAYAYALEHPAPGKLGLAPITRLGLLCVEPIDIARDEHKHISYVGDVTWLEIPKDEQAFLSFTEQVMDVLTLPEPPAPSDSCGFCKYRAEAREHGL